MGFDRVPKKMGWGEAWRLTHILANDPSSHVGCAIRGWEYPVTREDAVLRDLFDAFSRVNFFKPKPYGRPWPTKSKQRTKPHQSLTQAEIIEALRNAGHDLPLPVGA